MRTLFRTAIFVVALGCSSSLVATADEAAIAICKGGSSAAVGGAFELTSHTGAAMTERDFLGRKSLVFFGVTYCPDVCPLAIFNIATALKSVPEARRPVAVFISVDPVRDTPHELARYVSVGGFPDDLVGLTGSTDELKAVNEAFQTGVFPRGDNSESHEGYLVNHSNGLYLMNENWEMEAHFDEDASPVEIALCINLLS